MCARSSSHSLIENEILTEVVDFLVLFSGASEHIKNPYLRCKFISVIHSFLPDYSGSDKLGQVMFETNASVSVPHLTLKIFADAEQAVGPYEKFNVRREMGRISASIFGQSQSTETVGRLLRNQVAILREICRHAYQRCCSLSWRGNGKASAN